jgi:hypothetical protein
MSFVNDAGDSKALHVLAQPRLHAVVVPLLLGLNAALAVSSLLQDSCTYDETSKLTSGVSYLLNGDFRLAPDHPPLGKYWAALPFLFIEHDWPGFDAPGWSIAHVWSFGSSWLFTLNDGERLLVLARCMMVLLLLALCLSTYIAGRMTFGAPAGLLALLLAALSPTLLAHGRLVGTDVPIALTVMLALIAAARLLARITLLRIVLTATAIAAAATTKMSWPLLLPALLAMGVAAVVRRAPMQIALRRAGTALRHATSRAAKAGVVTALVMLFALTTGAGIWTVYGFRAGVFPVPPDSARVAAVDPTIPRAAEVLAQQWARALATEAGAPRTGFIPATLRQLRDWRVLPAPYVHGLARTLATTSERGAYLLGESSATGFALYFPIAFAIKTPVAILLLLVAGLAALATARCSIRNGLLFVGLLTFAITYGGYVSASSLNIGIRHLLPVYPVFFVLAGAAVAWLRWPSGRLLLALAALWLGAATAFIHPHYLAYFNELVGGPKHGHLYLADSNLDWGQDLKRLAHYAEQHPAQPIKLAYFGSADPRSYGFPVELLPSSLNRGTPTALDGAATYVISVTHLLGVYEFFAQDRFWHGPGAKAYRDLITFLQSPAGEDTPRVRALREKGLQQYAHLRWCRFLYNLRRRPPDARIGYSLFVHRLTAKDVEEMTQP